MESISLHATFLEGETGQLIPIQGRISQRNFSWMCRGSHFSLKFNSVGGEKTQAEPCRSLNPNFLWVLPIITEFLLFAHPSVGQIFCRQEHAREMSLRRQLRGREREKEKGIAHALYGQRTHGAESYMERKNTVFTNNAVRRGGREARKGDRGSIC